MEQSQQAVENLLILVLSISAWLSRLFVVALVIGIVAFVIINRRNKRTGKTVSRKKILLRTLLPAAILFVADLILAAFMFMAFDWGQGSGAVPIDDDDEDRDWIVEESEEGK